MKSGIGFLPRVLLILMCAQTVIWSNEPLFSLGPVVKLGTGRTNSPALGEVMDRRTALGTDIKEGSKYALPGVSFAAGGHFTWHLSERFEADAAAGYSWCANTIVLKQMEDDAHEGLTERETVRSEAAIRVSSMQFPVSVRVNLPTRSAWFLKAGTALDVLLHARIESDEKITEEEFGNGTRVATSVDYKKHVAAIDKFSPAQIALFLGGGRRFLVGRNALDIAFEMMLPLTGSELYTTDFAFTNGTELNEVYSLGGSIDALQETGIRLNDFRHGSIRLTARYLFGIRKRT